MSVALYMDVHVPRAITYGLRLRAVDVLTSQEDGTREVEDDILLDRVTALGYVLFTQDEDLLREAAQRQERGEIFAGVIYAHQLKVTVGQCPRSGSDRPGWRGRGLCESGGISAAEVRIDDSIPTVGQ